MTTNPQKIFKNFNFLVFGKILGDVFTFLLFVVLSRTFGEEGIGQYSFAIAFTGFFVVFCEFGLYFYSIKELNHQGNTLGTCFGAILSLRLILSCVILGILLLALAFLPFSDETKFILVLIGLYQIFCTLFEGFTAVFIAREDAFYAGLLESSLKILTALVAIVMVFLGGGLVMVLTALPVLAFLQAFVAYRLIVKRYGKISLEFSIADFIRIMRQSLPYAHSTFLYPLASRVDVVCLGFLLGTASAGIYNVAYRVVFFLQFVPYFAGVALLPLLTRLASQSKTQLASLYRQTMGVAVLLGLPMASGMWLIAPDLIGLAFGEEFIKSVKILRMLTGLLFLSFLDYVLATFLMACNRQSERMRCQWGCAVANVGGNIFLIPVLGIDGAAIATVGSEALLVFLYIRLLVGNFGWPKVGLRCLVSAVGVIGMSMPFLLLPSIPQLLLIPVSIVCYFGVLALFRDIRINEFPFFLSMFKKNLAGVPTSG